MYEFVLKFSLADQEVDPSAYLDALFEAGCDDATIGVGKRGSIALDFARDAASAEEAVRSAVLDVQKAIPDAELIEIKPDLVNLADVADIIGCSRQNIRKYASGEMKTVKVHFPEPVLSGSTDFWHLYEVLSWLSANTELRTPRNLLEVSQVAAKTNLERQLQKVGAGHRLSAMVAGE